MRRFPHLAVLAGAAVLAAGCARTTRPFDPAADGIEPVEETAPPAPVVVYFVNSATVGADVFVAATAGDERRLGTVQPGGTARFELPSQTIRFGSATVVARLHPSTRAVQTGPFTVTRGEVFTVSLVRGTNALAVTPGRP